MQKSKGLFTVGHVQLCDDDRIFWGLCFCAGVCFSLRQLHSQNMGISDGWRKAFEVPTETEKKRTVEGWGRITVGSMWFVGQFATLCFPFKTFSDGHIIMWDGHIIMGPPSRCKRIHPPITPHFRTGGK